MCIPVHQSRSDFQSPLQHSASLPECLELLCELSLGNLSFDSAKTLFGARLIREGRIPNETGYFFAPFAEMVPSDASVDVQSRPLGENRFEITLTANRFIWLAHLCEPEGLSYSENDFDLWPGESKKIIAQSLSPDFESAITWMGKEK